MVPSRGCDDTNPLLLLRQPGQGVPAHQNEHSCHFIGFLPGSPLLEASSELHVLLLEVHGHVDILVEVTYVTGCLHYPILDGVGGGSYFLKPEEYKTKDIFNSVT